VDDMRVSSRGVLWLGLHCDVRCSFCYDAGVPVNNKLWVPLDDLKGALNKFRQFYLNDYVDFMGGEPTLHPKALEVVRHAAQIGLKPTLITHGMRLADLRVAQAYKDAGVHDFLVSIHGIGDTVRRIHGRGRDNALRQRQALMNMRELGIPFRFNVTVIRDNLDELHDIASYAIEFGARVVNFLTFNPHFEWADAAQIPFQVRHSEAAPKLADAIDLLTPAGIEANVRYSPLCILPGYESHIFTGKQLPWDDHEWDYNSWYDRSLPGRPTDQWYVEAGNTQADRHNYVQPPTCRECSLRKICDGIHRQYFARFGSDELRPRSGPLVTDPRHFIRNQSPVQHEPHEDTPPVDLSLSSPLDLTQFRSDTGNRAGIRTALGMPNIRSI
jgi:MoaA/NifB/PqqE/SkfB family radical SAM enzyme